MMLMRSGGTSSPRLSRSLFVAQSSPVVGWNARPTELRKPRANTRPPLPSLLNCSTAARIESPSSQRLHEDPTLTYILPSGPNTIVRVAWPPLGSLDTIVTGCAAPGSKRFTAVISATYIVSPRNAMPNGPRSPRARMIAESAWPSLFASGSLTIVPPSWSAAYSTLPGPMTRLRTPSSFWAKTETRNPAGTCSGASWARADAVQAIAITVVLIAARINPRECTFAGRHAVTARQRFGRCPLDVIRDLRFDVSQLLRRDPVFLEILFVQTDRVALAPCGKQLRRKRFTRFALVMGRMAAHAKRFRDQQGGTLPIATPVSRNSCSRVGVQHVVAIESRAPNSVTCGPIVEVRGQVVLFEARTQRDLIVLDDENGGYTLHRCEVRAFVRGRGLGRAVAHPREGDTRLVPHLERQSDAGDHRDHVADVRDGLEYALGDRAHMQVAPAAGGVVGREIGAQHVDDGHSHLAARRRIADHRRDDG